MAQETYQIIMAVVVALLGGLAGLLGFFSIRLIRGYDEQIKELFAKTKAIPGIETDIEWLKDAVKK